MRRYRRLEVLACMTLIGLAVLPSTARSQTIEGEWTNAPGSCGKYSTNNDNIRIRQDGYGILESFCTFTGGAKQSSTDWRMHMVCGTEGGADEPETSVEIRVVGHKLRLDVNGRVFYYRSKCGSGADSAADSQRTYWDHNGSVMYLEAHGRHRQFYYSQPRAGMADAGVASGALLFDGSSDGSGYDGTAYIFSRNCGSFSYHVAGPILDDHRRVVLRGTAPRIGSDCRVAGHAPDTLEFVLEPGE